uniref:Uncharacterized protein n=1 Tax=Tanacetum cinerariifolium TaxID=118510 RepID=A0A6L2KY05_TANCI|nr:hypothetical protein [Tanacetum cinerariifolium]
MLKDTIDTHLDESDTAKDATKDAAKDTHLDAIDTHDDYRDASDAAQETGHTKDDLQFIGMEKGDKPNYEFSDLRVTCETSFWDIFYPGGEKAEYLEKGKLDGLHINAFIELMMRKRPRNAHWTLGLSELVAFHIDIHKLMSMVSVVDVLRATIDGTNPRYPSWRKISQSCMYGTLDCGVMTCKFIEILTTGKTINIKIFGDNVGLICLEYRAKMALMLYETREDMYNIMKKISDATSVVENIKSNDYFGYFQKPNCDLNVGLQQLQTKEDYMDLYMYIGHGKTIMGEPLSPDHVFDFPMDESEPHPAYDFFAPGPLPGEPLRAEVDEPMVDPMIDELAESIVEVEEQMVAPVIDMEGDLAMLFDDDDFSDDVLDDDEDDEEVWEVGVPSTAAAEGHSLTLLAHGFPMPLSLIEDLCTRMVNLEYGYGQLVKKVIKVSEAKVANGIAIGETGPRVSAVEG